MSKPLFTALFVGHGSPMNVLADNAYTRDMQQTALLLPKPKGILVISAHWTTKGTMITGSAQPEQIYDFYGFPQELYEVIYKAPGSLEIAQLVRDIVGDGLVSIHDKRGIDHAAWAVMKHMYPEQQIPVLELNLDMNKNWNEHFELGKRLTALRSEGILVIGSGNIVHNLSDFAWDETAPHYPWAVEFDELVKVALLKKDFDLLTNYGRLVPLAKKAIPTDEHYLPMLYILAMMKDNESVHFVHESILNGSISMRSFQID